MLYIVTCFDSIFQLKKRNPALIKKKSRSRDLQASRKEILNAAFFEIFSKGFQGVSVDDIVKKTTLTKGAFYHQFPNKLDLGYALIEEVISPMIIHRWIKPLEAFENPIEGILHQLQKNIGDAEPSHLKLGCPLNNLVQEMSSVDKGFKKRLNAALNLWIDETEKHLERGQSAGFIKKAVNLKDIAHFIVMAHEGFYGMMKGIENPQLFKSLNRSLKIYFDSISN